MKPISTYVHGMMDYLSAVLLIALPFIMGWEGAAKAVLLLAGASMLAVSIMTRYELSLLKVIPMPVHLGIDFMTGIVLALTPFLFIADDTTVKTGVFLALGLMEMGAAMLTRTVPSHLGTTAPRLHPSV